MSLNLIAKGLEGYPDTFSLAFSLEQNGGLYVAVTTIPFKGTAKGKAFSKQFIEHPHHSSVIGSIDALARFGRPYIPHVGHAFDRHLQEGFGIEIRPKKRDVVLDLGDGTALISATHDLALSINRLDRFCRVHPPDAVAKQLELFAKQTNQQPLVYEGPRGPYLGIVERIE